MSKRRPHIVERKEKWIKNVIWNVIGEIKETDDIHCVALLVARYFGVTTADLKTKSKWWMDVAARQVAMTMARHFTKKTYVEIAKYFQTNDHTNVVNAVNKFDSLVVASCRASGVASPLVRDSLCNAQADKTYVRHKPRPIALGGLLEEAPLNTSEAIVRQTLVELIKWSEEDSYSASDDILPDLPERGRGPRLKALRNRAFAESIQYEGENMTYWRVTPVGRAYAEQHGLLAANENQESLKEAA